MQAATQLKLYQVFKAQFGEDNAAAIVTIIEEVIDNKIDAKKDVLLTTADKLELISAIKDAKLDTIKWVFGFFIALALMIIGLYLKIK